MHGKRYAIELGAGLAAYAAMLVASLICLRAGMPPQPLATIVAVSPMVPALGVCWAILRQLRRIDEFQRRLQLEALALAFAGTAFITFSYGFLENAGYPKISMFAVWPLMGALWIAGLAFCRWRYA